MTDEDELWTTSEVTEWLGTTSGRSTTHMLHHWGVRPVARQPGKGGQNLYKAADVRAAKAARPGRGTRTDLTPRY